MLNPLDILIDLELFYAKKNLKRDQVLAFKLASLNGLDTPEDIVSYLKDRLKLVIHRKLGLCQTFLELVSRKVGTERDYQLQCLHFCRSLGLKAWYVSLFFLRPPFRKTVCVVKRKADLFVFDGAVGELIGPFKDLGEIKLYYDITLKTQTLCLSVRDWNLRRCRPKGGVKLG